MRARSKISRMESIIKEVYTQNEWSLDFDQHPNDWLQVIKSRDWIEIKFIWPNRCDVTDDELAIITFKKL